MNCSICNSKNTKAIFTNYFKCLDCKIAFSSDTKNLRPAPEIEYWQDVYFHSKQKLFIKGLKEIEKLCGHKGILLDIGCGWGYFVKLSQDYGWESHGLEISEPAIMHCRKTLNITIFDKPLEELSIEENKYDVVTMWGVLDLIPTPLTSLNKVFSILKPDGLIFVRVNNFTYHRMARILENFFLFKKFGVKPSVFHIWGINKSSIKYLLKNCGFKDIHIKNSTMTSGDPYGSGGKFGKIFVIIVKFFYYIIAQIIYYLSFKTILLSSCLIVSARKPKT